MIMWMCREVDTFPRAQCKAAVATMRRALHGRHTQRGPCTRRRSGSRAHTARTGPGQPELPWTRQETTEQVGQMNRTLCGWAYYFQVGTVSRAYRARDLVRLTWLGHDVSWVKARSLVREPDAGNLHVRFPPATAPHPDSTDSVNLQTAAGGAFRLSEVKHQSMRPFASEHRLGDRYAGC